jgi:ElaA protein
MNSISSLEWRWLKLEDITGPEFYQIAKLRQEIFIVEQACLFADLDDLDPLTHHLLVTQNHNLVAYLRVLPPDSLQDPVYFSRVAAAIPHRKQGLGVELIQEAIRYIQEQFPGREIVISAQNYLETFYLKFGFERIGTPYTEDGIPHIAMRKLQNNH